MSGEPRVVEVAPERIARWVEGCMARHGDLAWSASRIGILRLDSPDGFVAELRPLVPRDLRSLRDGRADALPDAVQLERWAGADTVMALLLVRRGGYAVGVARGPTLVAHKVGTRYVQSRTAAGGWSQQRFARRRGNQADALVGAVQDHAVRVVLGADLEADGLIVGGDRALVSGVLEDGRLGRLIDLPRAALFDLPDPRLEVLRSALARGRAVRIAVTDPKP